MDDTVEISEADEISEAGDATLEDDDEFRRSLQRTRLVSPLTKVLAVALVAATAFSAGAWVGHRHSSTTGVRANLAAARTGANLAGAGPAAGGAIVGTVKLVDGSNVYIEDQSGTVTKVTTDASTTVRVSKPGTVSDLKPSDTVVVQGSTGKDGTVAASSISTGGGRGGFGGGGGGGGARSGGGGAAGQGSTQGGPSTQTDGPSPGK
ncbi:MAG: hypothetical protein QOI47_2319 [Actinomycetota bacterium]|jgi:uncharacterized membrane protein YgcG|nr:hypothetical protein [Actinomycetota bacterium]